MGADDGGLIEPYCENHFPIYMYIKSLLYTLDVHNVRCQFHLNKAGGRAWGTKKPKRGDSN